MIYVHCSVLFLSLILYGSSCSIIKPSFSCFTVNSQSEKFISCSQSLFTVAFRRIYHDFIFVITVKQKYLLRRIPYASNGSFNPYIITNKGSQIRKHNMAIQQYQRILIAINPANHRKVSLKKYQSHCVVQASRLCKYISEIPA